MEFLWIHRNTASVSNIIMETSVTTKLYEWKFDDRSTTRPRRYLTVPLVAGIGSVRHDSGQQYHSVNNRNRFDSLIVVSACPNSVMLEIDGQPCMSEERGPPASRAAGR